MPPRSAATLLTVSFLFLVPPLRPQFIRQRLQSVPLSEHICPLPRKAVFFAGYAQVGLSTPERVLPDVGADVVSFVKDGLGGFSEDGHD